MALRNLPPISITDPVSDDWTRGFWEAADQEQLVAVRCAGCGTLRMPPGRFCRECGSQDFSWEPLPGIGAIFTYTVVRTGPGDPYAPAVIEVDNAPGIRLISAVVDCDIDHIQAGMRVRVVWHKVSDALTLPYWTPA